MSYIDIVFDGPPAAESGRFVEVEDDNGASVKRGEWIERDDGYTVLRLPDPLEGITSQVEGADIHPQRAVWSTIGDHRLLAATFHVKVDGNFVGYITWDPHNNSDTPWEAEVPYQGHYTKDYFRLPETAVAWLICRTDGA